IGNYVFGKTLGEGTFGKVKLARHVLTGQEVAVKIVDKMHAPTLVREIETWRHMHHPNIIRLYEILCSESRIYMVMEYCTGGEAFDYICEHGKFDDQSVDAKRVVKQLVEAVGYCHDKDFVHRDLKLENVLLTTDLNVKLIDFGFTRRVNTRNLLDTYCGSVAYAAPEMILGKRYSGPQADVWSLGVILYTLLCGYLPFDDDSEAAIRQKILELDYELPDFLSADTKDLIQEMLKIEGPERIGINDILAHPWFASITE
ncbi:kinase-like domain-containing protein, partial [Powellomyces hirtus]